MTSGDKHKEPPEVAVVAHGWCKLITIIRTTLKCGNTKHTSTTSTAHTWEPDT